jgi:hypothetical protein
LLFFLLTLLLTSCASTRYVDRIEIVNPTEYDLLVDVRSREDGSRLPLGIAKHGTESLREQVLDVGENWIFAFNYLGEEVGSARIKRSELESTGWRVMIPEEVGAKLRERGESGSY